MASIKKVIVILIFIAALFSTIHAAKADINDVFSSINTLNGKAAPGEKLEYNITLRNGGTEPVHLSLNILFTGLTKITPSVLTLEPNEEKCVYVALTIKPDQKPGNILTKLFIFDEKGNPLESPIFLQGEILESPNSFMNVKITNITLPQSVTPKAPFSLIFHADNPAKNTTTIAKVTIPDKNITLYDNNINLIEGRNTIILNNLTLPKDMPAGDYNLIVELIFSNSVHPQGSSVITIKGYSSCDIKESKNTSLLGLTYSADIKNIGTIPTHCVVSSKISNINKGLISSITEGYKFNGNNVEWNISMPKGTEAIVYYKISYAPLLVLPFVAILLVGIFWYFTRKISLKKEIVDYKRYSGFMDLKIQLKIKNLSGKDIKDIKINDPLPAFIKEIRDYGTVPGKVTTKNKHKVVQWKINVLKSKEERVFSYKARTSVEVLGNLLLKPTNVEYKTEKGKYKEFSNALVLEVK